MYNDQTQGKGPQSSGGKGPEGVPDSCLRREPNPDPNPNPYPGLETVLLTHEGTASLPGTLIHDSANSNPLQTPRCVQAPPSIPGDVTNLRGEVCSRGSQGVYDPFSSVRGT